MNIQEYYSHPLIKKKISDYCSDGFGNISTEYIVGLHESFYNIKGEPFISAPKTELESFLNKGADIFRSVWDEKYVLGVFDIEYVNHNYPAEAFFNQEKVFGVLEPIYLHIENILNKFQINHLTLMTGQGYHFVFKIPIDAKITTSLSKISKISPTIEAKYLSIFGKKRKIVPKDVGLAYDSIGRLMEYIAHLLFKELKDYYGIPVTMFDAVTGNKEAISIDLSMYGDPIYMRDIRCPFSVYQKFKVFKDKFGDYIPLNFLITLPRVNNSLQELLEIRTNLEKAIEYAEKVDTTIPIATEGIKKLLKSYRFSKLRKIHKYFDSQEHDPPDTWYKTYDRLNLNQFPPCISHCLKFPNDHLLKPTNLQTLVRVLLKLNWHPKHIAGLIRSKYERDYNWGETFLKYDAATRANLYARVFSSLILAGIDKEEDLNCISHQEKGYCWQKFCGFDLSSYRL